jgi:putative hemolysin
MTIALFVAGLLLVATLTAAASALRSVNRIWLRHWVEERLAGGGRTSPSVEDVHRLLLAASTGVALVAFATGAAIGTRWAITRSALLEQIVGALLLVLVVGQLIPRAIGRRWATRLVPALVPGLRALSTMLEPLMRPARALADANSAPADAAAMSETGERETLEDLLRESELEGVGDPRENAIISDVVDFTEMRAADVMTPRGEIFYLDRSLAPAELSAMVAQAKYSRVPITDGTIDRVIGMLYAFDVFKWKGEGAPPIRNVMFVPATLGATDLLFKLLRERVHLAIVQDASLQTVGLVTLEDLLEEVVGDIHDEHDEPAA